MKKNIISIILISILAACSSAPELSVPPTLSTIPIVPSATNTSTPAPAVLWISPAVPPDLRLAMQDVGIPT
ncbi:MAG: hypothetical protein MUO77_10000, partial [Anaerolineales bacterium]|nr:hypothetical protein [Anaerolineales bacterium]